jgi:hypothetical protein
MVQETLFKFGFNQLFLATTISLQSWAANVAVFHFLDVIQVLSPLRESRTASEDIFNDVEKNTNIPIRKLCFGEMDRQGQQRFRHKQACEAT